MRNLKKLAKEIKKVSNVKPTPYYDYIYSLINEPTKKHFETVKSLIEYYNEMKNCNSKKYATEMSFVAIEIKLSILSTEERFKLKGILRKNKKTLLQRFFRL